MSAEESLRAGEIDSALAQLQDDVRREPASAKHRVFLFQLLAVMGQWKRAFTQLNVAGDLDATTRAMVQTYREAINCEVLRAEVFAGRGKPLLLGAPKPWMAQLIEALRLEAGGEHAQAASLRGQAFEAAPTTSGTVDGRAFAWIADADQRFGPMLEVIVGAKYQWIPFSRLRAVQIEKPVDLRDAAWTPAYLTLSNGGQIVGFIPTRYPGSESSNEGAIRLGRRTDWMERAGGAFQGLGQRLLATDAGEVGLMDARQINLDAAADAADHVAENG